MVALIDFKKCAIERYEKAKKQIGILTDLERQGVISDRLKRYFNQMLLLECLSEEAEAYALDANLLAVNESILEMKKFLMGIKYNYFEDINNPELGNCYQELYNLAQERCKATSDNLSKIVER